MSNYNIFWGKSEWLKIANSKFLPLITNTDRILIMYGSRSSSKSYFAACKILYRCLTEQDFKCVIIRNVDRNIRGSSFAQLLKCIKDLKLEQLFNTTTSPLEIRCKNGNTIVARGMNNPSGIKSIEGISCIWFEEDIPNSETDWLKVSHSMRNPKAKYIQEIWTLNPQLPSGDFKTNWFYKRFFEANEGQLDFTNKISISFLDEKTEEEETIELGVTVHHSTIRDNRWASKQDIARLMSYKDTDPHTYETDYLGLWSHTENLAGFYKDFNRIRNVFDASQFKYDPEKPIHISFDFNLQPYMTALVFQIDLSNLSQPVAYCIKEVLTVTPNNSSKGLCREIIRQFPFHNSGCYIYGDSNGFKKDTRTENVDDYVIIMTCLKQLNPKLRASRSNPHLATRGDFINECFRLQNGPIKILISDKCTTLINDLMFTKENQDGGKLKEKETINGIVAEKYGHTGDALDYFITKCFEVQYLKNKRGGRVFEYKLGVEPENNRLRF